MLVACKTLEAAAERTGVSVRTMRRWLTDPLFEVEYRHARRQALDEGIAALQCGVSEAAEVLRDALGERNVHARIRAALGLLEYGLAANAQFNLAERLRVLEEASGEQVTW